MPKTPWEKKCLRCWHEWIARITNPSACPKCKSYKWDVPKDRTMPMTLTETPWTPGIPHEVGEIVDTPTGKVKIIGVYPKPNGKVIVEYGDLK